MPIRQGGTWPRDHFCRSTNGAALIEPDDVERILADIDPHRGDGRI
jgi:hypothetical protein